jgi:hypothetical protein
MNTPETTEVKGLPLAGEPIPSSTAGGTEDPMKLTEEKRETSRNKTSRRRSHTVDASSASYTRWPGRDGEDRRRDEPDRRELQGGRYHSDADDEGGVDGDEDSDDESVPDRGDDDDYDSEGTVFSSGEEEILSEDDEEASHLMAIDEEERTSKAPARCQMKHV